MDKEHKATNKISQREWDYYRKLAKKFHDKQIEITEKIKEAYEWDGTGPHIHDILNNPEFYESVKILEKTLEGGGE